MKSEPLSKRKCVSEEQLRAWDILGESPILYVHTSSTGTVPWLYKWQLKGGVVYHTESDGTKRTRKSTAKSLATCTVHKRLYLSPQGSAMKKTIEDSLIKDFKQEAAIVLSKYKHRVNMATSANKWGGVFTSLPDEISYNDVAEYLEDNR